jgi:spore coat protein CotH
LERRKKVESINQLEEILYNIQNENNPNYIFHKKEIDKKVNEMREWIKNNNDEKIEEYEKKIIEINNFKNIL